MLTQRIDVVLVRGGLTAGGAALVGDDKKDRTASGLWPSDHDGVVATVTQTVNFDLATGVLSVQSDSPSGNDSVTVKAAGAVIDAEGAGYHLIAARKNVERKSPTSAMAAA